MKTNFWRINENRFRYRYYESMCDCTMDMVNRQMFCYYDYDTSKPDEIGELLGREINVTPPVRFDLDAFNDSGVDTIDAYEFNPVATRDTYLKNKAELEADDFALTPPAITVIPSYRNTYDHLSPMERPRGLPKTSYGEILSLKKDGKEKFQGYILHRFGHLSYYTPSYTFLAKTLDDRKRKSTTCHETVSPKPEI